MCRVGLFLETAPVRGRVVEAILVEMGGGWGGIIPCRELPSIAKNR